MDLRTLQILAEIYIVWLIFGDAAFAVLSWLIGAGQ